MEFCRYNHAIIIGIQSGYNQPFDVTEIHGTTALLQLDILMENGSFIMDDLPIKLMGLS